MSFHERGIFSNRNVSGRHKKQGWPSALGTPGTARWKTRLLELLECLNVITFAPVTLLLEIYSSETKALEVKIFRRVFTAAFFIVAKKIQKINNRRNHLNVHQQGKRCISYDVLRQV